MPPKREIIYPVFLECCQYTEDTFWENIFEDLAYGKSPYGTYISKDFICCSYKGKEFSYKIERKDPEILYTDIYSLFTDKLGILSQKEKVKKRLDFHELEKTIKESRQDWGNIRKKNVKDILYEKYVIEMKNRYSLTNKQTKYLFSIILISIMFKTISSKDITYENDKIQDISGIEFEKGKIILKRSLCSDINIESNIPNNVEFKKMSEGWDRYLKNLRK
jgi:hypothetical protein